MFNRSALLCAALLGVCAFPASAADLRISGPYTHDNLSIFLLHAGAPVSGGKLLTLQEAMDQKKAVVYETGSVNQLSIENLSTQDVYIQSGDIVKGGRQDRVLSTDFILPAHSGKVPIDAFCVEHGRWTKRGSEAADRFEASNIQVSGKSVKMAVRAKNQQAVWDGVAGVQGGLAVAAPRAFAPPASGSMQLALESKPVADATGSYLHDLEKILEGKSDVVGFAYAINGKLDSADVYVSADLFRRMWPKLLRSSAVEALQQKVQPRAAQTPSAADVKSLLAEGDGARQTSQEQAGRAMVARKESSKVLLLESHDGGSAWLHKSYVVK